MKRLALLYTCLLNSIYSLHSQTDLTADHMAEIGMEINYVWGLDDLEVHNEGENQTWDFSGLSNELNFNYTFQGYDEELNNPEFSDATLVAQLQGGLTYYSESATEIRNLGGEYPGEYISTYTTPFDKYRFPMSYLDSYEDSYEEETLFLEFKQTTYNEGDVTVSYDAYGEIYLPFDTVMVIRIKTVLNDRLFVEEDTIQVTTINYDWFSPEFSGLVASYNEVQLEDGEIIQETWTFLDEPSFNVLEELAEPIDFSIYPNPSGDIIHINSQTAFTELTVTDSQGRLVKTESFLPSIYFVLDISEFESGVFLISVSTKYGFSNKTLVKN